MVSDSKMRHGAIGAVNDSPSAINVARPVRAGRRLSSGLSHQSFDSTESVADALAHLFPAAQIHTSRPVKETVGMEHIDNEAEPSAYPVTPTTTPVAPAFSPLTPLRVNSEVGAGAETGSVRRKNTPERSPTRKSKKRKASPHIPVTPPPRRLRLRSHQITATSEATWKSAPKILKAPKSASTAKGKKSTAPAVESTAQSSSSSGDSATVLKTANGSKTTNPLIALARNIEDPNAFINAVNGSDSITLDSDESLPANATDNMSATDRVRHNLSVIGHQLLRRQRVLIHDYDTFDVQTYNPGVQVDAGTVALRQFVGILREGLSDMESILATLDDSRDAV
ncbi:hypothetical protein KCU71_g3094, partial [Aureobasidium melanogenum]